VGESAQRGAQGGYRTGGSCLMRLEHDDITGTAIMLYLFVAA
jgi:hypothetical protein